jgi:hypothetical protein
LWESLDALQVATISGAFEASAMPLCTSHAGAGVVKIANEFQWDGFELQ